MLGENITSNHVLNVIGMSGAVDMSVMSLFSLIFDSGGVDSDTSGLFFGGLIDAAVIDELSGT
jgi:hypothetical protein